MTDPNEHTKDRLTAIHREVVGEDPPSSATKADIAEAIDSSIEPSVPLAPGPEKPQGRRQTFVNRKDGRRRTVTRGTRAARRYESFEVWEEQ